MFPECLGSCTIAVVKNINAYIYYLHEGWDHIDRFNTATYLSLFQSGIWISNVYGQ